MPLMPRLRDNPAEAGHHDEQRHAGEGEPTHRLRPPAPEAEERPAIFGVRQPQHITQKRLSFRAF